MTTLTAPPKLCIYSEDSRASTLNFLNFIDHHVILQNSDLTVDLSMVKDATAAASVLLFAIVNRAQFFAKNSKVIRFIWPKKDSNSEGHRWIVATGLSKALVARDIGKLEVLTKEGQYFQSSVQPYEHLIATVAMLQKSAVLNEPQLDLLTTAISEAMLNVLHHAYEDDDFNDQLQILKGKRWWQCAWFDENTNAVVFIICDLGLGICKSYENGKVINSLDQPKLVFEALSLGNSRYRGSGRGNGSEDIKRPIGAGCAESETLLVFTGHTRYIYNSFDDVPSCEYVKEYIPGTLVEWSLVPRRDT